MKLPPTPTCKVLQMYLYISLKIHILFLSMLCSMSVSMPMSVVPNEAGKGIRVHGPRLTGSYEPPDLNAGD